MHSSDSYPKQQHACESPVLDTVEPRFNEVAGDRPSVFVNLDITNLRGKVQNVGYIEVIVND